MATAPLRRRRSLVAANSGRATAARVISAITAIATLILLVGIALVLLKANQGNDIVAAIHDAAAWLAGPFDGMFSFDKARTETAVNWGIAAAVWFVVGRLLARVIAP